MAELMASIRPLDSEPSPHGNISHCEDLQHPFSGISLFGFLPLLGNSQARWHNFSPGHRCSGKNLHRESSDKSFTRG